MKSSVKTSLGRIETVLEKLDQIPIQIKITEAEDLIGSKDILFSEIDKIDDAAELKTYVRD
jgi:hypothetical protein